MKLTEEQKELLGCISHDKELFHLKYDELALRRLKELDEEYYNDLLEARREVDFWYA